MNVEQEAKELAALICSDPPMSREKAAAMIAAALGLAQSEGNISGMQYVSNQIDEAFRPAKVA